MDGLCTPSKTVDSLREPLSKTVDIVVAGELKLQRMIRHSKWDKISVVLYKDDGTFTYHKIDSSDDQVYVVNLENATIFQHIERYGIWDPNMFCIRTPFREYLLEAPSPEDKKKWIKTIVEHIPKKNFKRRTY